MKSKLHKKMVGFSNVADPKNRRMLKNAAIGFGVKGGALIISLFAIPSYMRFFEQQQVLGVWFTAVSLLSWILTFDLGIGNGLRNYLVEPIVKKDMAEVRRLISSAYFIVGVFVLIVSAFGYIIIPYITWNRVFNISKYIVSADLLVEVVRYIFLGIMIQFLLRLVSSVYYAMQKPAIPNFLNLLSNTIILLYLLTANSGATAANLKALSRVNILATNLPLLGATIYIFSGKLRACIPQIRYFSKEHALKVMKLGGKFFWLQIMTMFIFNTNEFLISWFVGPEKVVEYQIYNKLFSLVNTVFQIALTPVWSEVTEACARQEYAWIERLYKYLKKAAMVAMLGEIVLLFCLQLIINIWLGKRTIHVDYSIALFFAGSSIVYIWTTISSTIAAGTGELKTALIFLSAGALLNVPLAYIFVHLLNSWAGVILANIVSMLFYCICQPIALHRWFNMIKGQVK